MSRPDSGAGRGYKTRARDSPSAVILIRATLGALKPYDPMIPCLCVESARPSETGDLPLGKAARCCVAQAARGGDACSLLLRPGRRILPPSPRVPEGFVSPWPTAGRHSSSRAAKPHDLPPGTQRTATPSHHGEDQLCAKGHLSVNAPPPVPMSRCEHFVEGASVGMSPPPICIR